MMQWIRDFSGGALLLVVIMVGLIFGDPDASPSAYFFGGEESRIIRESRDVSGSGVVGEPFRGTMYATDETWLMTHRQLGSRMEDIAVERRSGIYSWVTPSNTVFARSAESVRGDFHFLPGYLVGWKPFETEHAWQSWYAVSQRITYAYDHVLFGRGDVWQTGPEVWRMQKGDCEDHALLLADWLIQQGEDARVVLGYYKNEYHAWVVIIRGNRTYLLEGTRRFGRNALRSYPLASTKPWYRPDSMFNRDTLWINEGTSLTTDYLSDQWRVAGRFERR